MLNKVCYLTASIAGTHFSMAVSLFNGNNRQQSIFEGRCAYFTTLVATIHIITSGLWLIRENLNDMFI